MQILEVIEIGVILLFLASLVGIFVARLRMPYTVGLLLVGSALAILSPYAFGAGLFSREAIRELVLPEVILGILVPPLIYEAAFHLKLDELRQNLGIILAFAVPGVIVTMLVVGGAVAWGAGLALPAAMIFGALAAATDPVAVVALFRSLGVPQRILVLLEGESLFNDGTAIVVFTLALGVAQTGARFSLIASLADFLIVAVGGLVIGVLLGSLTSYIIARVDDYLVEITLTGVAAYGAYLVAERFGLSGVLAVVAAGLVSGNVGPRGMTPTTRIALFNFWEYAAFLANSIVFLFIGLVIDLNSVLANWPAILLAIGAVLLSRFAIIYGFAWFRKDLSLRVQHVLFWGGLRGAISLALALSLSRENAGADLEVLQAMSFGVVLFSILVQGTTMGPLAKRLGLVERSPAEEEYQRRQARSVATQAAYDRIEHMRNEGLISDHTWQLMEPPLRRQIEHSKESVREILARDQSVELAELATAYQEALRAQRITYSQLLSSGVLSEDNFGELTAEIDSALASERPTYGDVMQLRASNRPPITRLISAVLHEDDAENAISSLNILGVPATQFAGASGGRGSPRTTLLIAAEAGQEQDIVAVIRRSCTHTPESHPDLFETIPALPGETLQVDGLSLYVFDIERYVEI